MANGQIFERVEKKYIVSESEKNMLMSLISAYITSDKYGLSTINSIYFDTPDNRIIRNSLEKPLYKEKIRLRSYGTPKSGNASVFLELKKKYKSIVYKRREILTLDQARNYILTGILPKDTQIMREIDYAMHFYEDIAPAIFISYDRRAYYGVDDENLRITFDRNLLFRTDNLFLEAGTFGTPLLNPGLYIMEIKTTGAMPLWLADALDECKVFPASFSKYGTAYCNYIIKKENLIYA